MIISLYKKFLFIHIPKTAGTSIKTELEKYGERNHYEEKKLLGLYKKKHAFYPHTTASELIDTIGEKPLKNIFKFAFVRNPWDRMLSLYTFTLLSAQKRLEHKLTRKDHISEEDDKKTVSDLGGQGFNKWLISTDYNNDIYGTPLTRLPQSHWLTDQNNEIIVDFIGKYESLYKDLSSITSRLNIKVNLSHLNRSNHDDWWKTYDENAFNFVKKHFQDDIEKFNYKFTWNDVLQLRSGSV